jgi:hypothetical protein
MKAITFKANDVTYNEAIGGEIVQVCFDEDSDQDPFERNKCYLLISQNYEFGHDEPTLEWHDGKDANGGSRVSSYSLEESILELATNDGVLFSIQHNCKKEVLIRIRAFLESEYRNLKQI